MRLRWRPTLWWTAAVLATAIGTSNVLLSVAGLALPEAVPQSAHVGTVSVPARVAAVLLLHCALAHTVGLLFRRMRQVRSRPVVLAGAAASSLASSWTALFNTRSLLAPGFTFSTGSVVMTNPYLLVVAAYLACACISLGFIFLNGSESAGTNRVQPSRLASVHASALQGLSFVVVGIVTAA
jgi:hypothetical protein